MFIYFDKNYSWHAHFLMAMLRGGNMSEIHDYCGHLRDRQDLKGQASSEVWFDAWNTLARHVDDLGRTDEDAGHLLSAGRKYARASNYYFSAEKMLSNRDPRKAEAYDSALRTFRKGVECRNEALEWVEVPFGATALPALYVPANSDRPARCLVHFNGWDGTKEIVYQRVKDEFRNRGTSLLIVDHPGTGEALRRRGLHLDPATEVAATACVDYLLTRPDVDPERIGVLGIAVGSYHAARAAAFEKRFKCAVSWGGYWEPPPDLIRTAEDPSIESVPAFHNIWVTGAPTSAAAADILRLFTLDGVIDKVECPLLVVAGENDRRQGLSHARREAQAAVRSPRAELKVFTAGDGSTEYCQNDNASLGLDFVADWTSEVLGGTPPGV